MLLTELPLEVATALPTYCRTYSRWTETGRETWAQTCDRALSGIQEMGQFTLDELRLMRDRLEKIQALPSGRWLWIGGTDWIRKSENYSGAYNCTSITIDSWHAFGLMMELAMMGCGTGAVIEPDCIDKLPPIKSRIREVDIIDEFGFDKPGDHYYTEETIVNNKGMYLNIIVGDSRKGWVKAYQSILEWVSLTDYRFSSITIDLRSVRPTGTPLKGFGGVANPVRLPLLFERVARILNGAVGRKLNSAECTLLIDEAATTIVVGNIRRSAGIREGSPDDENFVGLKDGLWTETSPGNWSIPPELDPLRMANHTIVYHQKPTLEQCIESVRSQFYSGEGAIKWAGEAVARANADLLDDERKRKRFLDLYQIDRLPAKGYLQGWAKYKGNELSESELQYRIEIYSGNPCGEIVLKDNHCNLSEVQLNRLDPYDFNAQEEAFKAAALWVSALLHHQFEDDRLQQSREIDPIVGVSFTGWFDFCVAAFGIEWLEWCVAGRPDTVRGIEFKEREKECLTRWREIVENTVWEYCDRHNLKRPNRCTTVQPSGTKSLLTGASPGWHPPKAARYIRRITFRKNDPVALACLDYGYNIVPSQSDKDDNGNLLDDPFDPRCSEWLVEIPVAVSWAHLPGADTIDISQFSALAQLDFYLQVQKHYVRHNTSATIELRESEIEALGTRIYEAIRNDEGYISVAILARFDDHQSFPRLPFEPIDKDQYDRACNEVRQRRKTASFHSALDRYDTGYLEESGPAGCDSDKCLLPE